MVKSQRKRQNKEERNKRITNQPENNNKLSIISSYLSIITLNISGLSSLSKRHRMFGCIKRTNTHKTSAHKRLTSDQRAHIQAM